MMSKTLRLEILRAVYLQLVTPQIEYLKKTFYKDIREAAIADPLNFEANEVFSRYKVRWPHMFNASSLITFRVIPADYPDISTEDYAKSHYGFSSNPLNIFHYHHSLDESIWKHLYSKIDHYSDGYVYFDPLIICNYTGHISLKTPSAGKKLSPIYFAHIKKANKELKEAADLISGLYQIMLSCKTVEEFIDGYPEFKEFIPEAELPMHPMVSVGTVNSTLKILKNIKVKNANSN